MTDDLDDLGRAWSGDKKTQEWVVNQFHLLFSHVHPIDQMGALQTLFMALLCKYANTYDDVEAGIKAVCEDMSEQGRPAFEFYKRTTN